jgi:hypothetical protein
MSYSKPLSNSREHLFTRDWLDLARAQFLQPSLGDGCPFSINFGIRRIEGAKERVDNKSTFLYRKRFCFVYDFGCAWHICHLMLGFDESYHL